MGLDDNHQHDLQTLENDRQKLEKLVAHAAEHARELKLLRTIVKKLRAVIRIHNLRLKMHKEATKTKHRKVER